MERNSTGPAEGWHSCTNRNGERRAAAATGQPTAHAPGRSSYSDSPVVPDVVPISIFEIQSSTLQQRPFSRMDGRRLSDAAACDGCGSFYAALARWRENSTLYAAQPYHAHLVILSSHTPLLGILMKTAP